MCAKGNEINGLPVDSENKATVLRVWSFQRPHMLSFHLSWMSFFLAFLSTFSPAAMIPVIRDDLDLQKGDLGNAAVASMLGIVGCRIIMGSVCDYLGPRYGHAFLMSLTAPAVFGIGLINGAGGFIACRIVIGFCLATFVACQFWCSVLFNVKIVGAANATGGGWGNLGGGVTQLLMPVIYTGISSYETPFIAWRYSFIIPGLAHILISMLILCFGQDLPEGNYSQLKKAGGKAATGSKATTTALLNYRTWILTILYGYCFGVELTVNNVVNSYFTDNFNLSLTLAGLCGSLFGLMNLFARSLGGLTSDWMARPFGMRGRLWAYFIMQTAEGGMCIVLGFLNETLGGTIALIVFFSLFVQAAEGACFGIVPFVSKRGLGMVSGLVGAGGNAGSGLMLALFFQGNILDIPIHEGFRYMGIMIIGLTVLLMPLVWFPMWGGMFLPAKSDATEEDYYGAEFTPEERASGVADPVMKFARESRSQRGSRRNDKDQQAQS